MLDAFANFFIRQFLRIRPLKLKFYETDYIKTIFTFDKKV